MSCKARKSVSLALLITQLVVCITSSAYGQSAADKPPAGQDRPLKLRTDEVVVDAVVLDKKNHAISDLATDDFELYEDGVKQKITSFRFESISSAAQTLASGPRTASGGPRTINLISLVFDAQTDRDGSLRARKAALDYIANGIGPDDYVAVFGIDLGLMILAPYTNDKVAIKQAVEAFTSRDSKKYLAVAGEARRALESLVEPLSDAKKVGLAETITQADLDAPPPLVEGARDPSSGISPTQVTLAAISLSGLRILRVFERYEREYQGYRDVDALMAIINGLKNVRVTRKVLLLFSEGFAVTPAVTARYKSVISAANTTGVTIYALDIAGLRVLNPNEPAMVERDASALARIRNQNPELVSGGVSAIGRNEDVARLNTVSTLDELSEETGGYAIKNTNDMSEGLKRILDEIGNHYVMTYQPTNANYDGKFRRINLRVVRTGDFKVRARRGYYALRTLDDSPVMAHEVPLLERANSASAVNDFPFHLRAFHFRGGSAARQVALYAEFPVSALTFDTDDKTKTFSSKFAILVLVRNAANEIVRKVGQEYSLKGPLTQVEDVKKRPQLFNRITTLAPGQYTIEAVARDSSTGKASVARVLFEVPPAPEDSLSISSVVMSRGVNPLTEEQKKQATHPLYLEERAYFVPNIDEAFSLARDKNLLVHFNVYAPKGSTSKVNVTLAFLKGGSIFTQAGGQLPDVDATGRISYSTSFGSENFPAGDYELRVTVSDGPRRASSTAHFKIEP
jgi:VWFA-related protein